jgi:phosphohistidine swiveling domain-containing protein
VIASLQELDRIRPGDIVVTYSIDPAWTPVFGIIAGVVSVEGGMLAHAAVLGREYGLPVVLAVREATARLKSGDVIRIDGTAGTVTMIAAGGEAVEAIGPAPHAVIP